MPKIDIPAILAKHNAEHGIVIKLYELNGQCMFPVLGGSGGLVAAVTIYFYVGELEKRDLGRVGLVRHAYGLSWAVELPYWDGHENEPRILRALNDFDEILRAEAGWQ